MSFPGLVHGRLLRRYKRFLADVALDDGSRVTAHCPNTGSMKNCAVAGSEVWLSQSDNPRRKYRYTWELARNSRRDYLCVNTGLANRVVAAAINGKVVAELAGYGEMQREVRYGLEGSRIDFLLSHHRLAPNCYVEVKSVTLLEAPAAKGIGYFPDAVSERGAKHLRELMQVVRDGYRGLLFFCVQHAGIREVRPAEHLDPNYSRLLVEAVAAGVEVLAYKARFNSFPPKLGRRLPVRLPDSADGGQ